MRVPDPWWSRGLVLFQQPLDFLLVADARTGLVLVTPLLAVKPQQWRMLMVAAIQSIPILHLRSYSPLPPFQFPLPLFHFLRPLSPLPLFH